MAVLVLFVACAVFGGTVAAKAQIVPSHGGKVLKLTPLSAVPAGMQAIICASTTSGSINLDKLTWKRSQPGPQFITLQNYPHCRVYTAPATGVIDTVWVNYRGAKAFTRFSITHPVRP